MKKKTKFIIGGSIVGCVVIALILSSAMHNMQYYKSVDELIATKPYGENLRVSGRVEDGSILSNRGKYKLKFDIKGKKTKTRLTIGYDGIVPDAFKPGVEVILEGSLNKENVFYAEKLLTKCPSKYKSEE